MTQAPARRLRALERRARHLAADLAGTGFISSGSLVQRWMPCGKPGCRCQGDPPQLHGPYWQLTRRVDGRTRTLRLSERQAALYREWIARRRRLERTLAAMEAVSQQAAEILLQEPEAVAEDAGAAGRPPALGRLARLLIEVSESMEPLLEAAQAWADARDDEDRELQAQSRQDLRQALKAAPALGGELSRLSDLIRQHSAGSNSN